MLGFDVLCVLFSGKRDLPMERSLCQANEGGELMKQLRCSKLFYYIPSLSVAIDLCIMRPHDEYYAGTHRKMVDLLGQISGS